jgi:hypothetical protein
MATPSERPTPLSGAPGGPLVEFLRKCHESTSTKIQFFTEHANHIAWDLIRVHRAQEDVI